MEYLLYSTISCFRLGCKKRIGIGTVEDVRDGFEYPSHRIHPNIFASNIGQKSDFWGQKRSKDMVCIGYYTERKLANGFPDTGFCILPKNTMK